MLERGRYLREKQGKKYQESRNPSHQSIKGCAAQLHQSPPDATPDATHTTRSPAVCNTGGWLRAQEERVASWEYLEEIKSTWKEFQSQDPCRIKIIPSSQWWRGSQVVQWQRTCLPVQEKWIPSLIWEGPLEKEMAIHSSTLAWRMPWTEEPGRLQPMRFHSRTWLCDKLFTFHTFRNTENFDSLACHQEWPALSHYPDENTNKDPTCWYFDN